MNITAIRIYTTDNYIGIPSESYVEFPLVDLNSNLNYIVKGITGLEPPAVPTKGSRTISNNFGATEARQVDILLALNPTYGGNPTTISDLREEFYKKLTRPISGDLSIRLYNGDNEVARASGDLVRIETDLFSVEPELLITVSCKNYLFISPTPYLLYGDYYGYGPHVDHTDKFIGYVNAVDGKLYFSYSDDMSTAPHGLYLEIEVKTQYLFGLDIQTYFADTKISSFLLGIYLGLGKRLIVSSIFGDLKVIRRSTTDNWVSYTDVSQISTVSPASLWPALYPGDNVFRLTNGSSFNIRSLYHFPTYWGV